MPKHGHPSSSRKLSLQRAEQRLLMRIDSAMIALESQSKFRKEAINAN
jgi:hypothetical protein